MLRDVDDHPGESGGSSRPAGSVRARTRPDANGARTRPSHQAADEARAAEARGRLHTHGFVPIEPDPRIGVLLGRDEVLVAVRRGVSVNRRQPCPDEDRGVDGDLYVTSHRLVHLGRPAISYDLAAIREAVVVGDRLLLILDDGVGMAIVVDDPSHLRVEISAARAASRREGRPGRRAEGGLEDPG